LEFAQRIKEREQEKKTKEKRNKESGRPASNEKVPFTPKGLLIIMPSSQRGNSVDIASSMFHGD
jgi:hypothetical protein